MARFTIYTISLWNTWITTHSYAANMVWQIFHGLLHRQNGKIG